MPAPMTGADMPMAGTRIYFLGDVYLPRPVRLAGELPDPLIYNLEAPITRAERGWPGTVNLRCEGDHAAATFGKHPLAVCLANNHIMDFGATGVSDTLERLDAAGVAYYGAGDDADNCRNPLLLPMGEHCLGLVGYVCPTAHPVFAVAGVNPGVARIALDRIGADIRTARARGATRVAVCLHWGIEELGLPRPEDVLLARRIAELGADVVIGHHAHCIQPFEVHEGVPIFYGLGNAIFPDVDAWADYDDDGRPGTPYRKLQNYWNEPSLAVAYDVADGSFRVDRLRCDGKVLRVVRRGVDGPRLAYPGERAYASIFARRRFRATWRTKLVNLVRRPKLPRARHLRSLGRIFQEARGRE